MKLIDFECHIYTDEYVTFLRSRDNPPREEVREENNTLRRWYEPSRPDYWVSHGRSLESRLLEVGEGRIEAMDRAGVDVQVLSLTVPAFDQMDPGVGLSRAKQFNDRLAEIVSRHPTRFRGWASLAPLDPEGSADELTRAVEELGFIGAMVQSHVGDQFLDHERFNPLLERAAELEVPIYIHPTVPHGDMLSPFLGYGWELAGTRFAGASETALHLLRLIFGGVFDRFPELTVMVGHLGEGLPFWLYRIQAGYEKHDLDPDHKVSLNKSPADYIQDNVYVTTSGAFSVPLFMGTYMTIGADRILFSSDYPYEALDEASSFVQDLPIGPGDRERIGHQNAFDLLDLT